MRERRLFACHTRSSFMDKSADAISSDKDEISCNNDKVAFDTLVSGF